ncbi:hypothetical protein D9757_012946 [Collybiopsis confluens]|uniref:Uncharacterized protein n=1 Tax=Collybiopsis confluens TaxID=2823264 RepID=A0A8H5D6R4_9AGAR|nr:hypothetical protein D9757_012946 [Collybiopsis confluens]
MAEPESNLNQDFTALNVSSSHPLLFSEHSTPQSRDGVTFVKAKRWLASWLVPAGLYCCHATLAPFSARVNEFAHILVPQRAFGETQMLEDIENGLGMKRGSLCLHSRLFLMPLYFSVHRALDWYQILFIPTAQTMRLVIQYLGDFMVELTKNGEYRPWNKLRDGLLRGLEGLQAGEVFTYRLLTSPHNPKSSPIVVHDGERVRVFVRPHSNLPYFRSHVSPFAVLVNALRTLEDWENPRKFTPIWRHRLRPDIGAVEELMLRALLGVPARDEIVPGSSPKSASVPPLPAVIDPSIHKLAELFGTFVDLFHNLMFAGRTRASSRASRSLLTRSRRLGSPDSSRRSNPGVIPEPQNRPSPPSRNQATKTTGMLQFVPKIGGSGTTSRSRAVALSKETISRVMCFITNSSRPSSPSEAEKIRDGYRTTGMRSRLVMLIYDIFDLANSLAPTHFPSRSNLAKGSPIPDGTKPSYRVMYDTSKAHRLLGLKYRSREEFLQDTFADYMARGW